MSARKPSSPVAAAKPPKLTSTSDMLHALWGKARSQMTAEDVAAYASSMSLVHPKITSLQMVVEQMTDQITGQDGTPSPMLASELLYPLFELTSQLDTLAAMAFISSEAAFELANPDLFQPGGPLHSKPVADHGAR